MTHSCSQRALALYQIDYMEIIAIATILCQGPGACDIRCVSHIISGNCRSIRAEHELFSRLPVNRSPVAWQAIGPFQVLVVGRGEAELAVQSVRIGGVQGP